MDLFNKGGKALEIRVLRYFMAVVREESITKAADVLHITQPTLSRQLTQMEDELGVVLFHRGIHGITLTNEGILLRRRAEEILLLVDKTEQELVSQDEQLEGVVSIGGGELASVSVLAKMCRSFQMLHPHVKFEMHTVAADAARTQMNQGLLDIGLLLEPVDMEKFDYIRLAQKERWAVFMPERDVLAKKESITKEDLLGKPIILPSRLNVQSELANWFGEEFSKLNVVMTVNLTSNGSVMVENGIGYAIAVEGSYRAGAEGRVVSRPISPELTATSVLAWRRGQPFGRAAEKFIEFIRNTV
jgi:DNA-binding transcriptional LysR family regulator